MKFTNLIGVHLKDDVMLELLENHDIEVVYDFDRNHENMPDVYWATSEKDGFQLRFDQNQLLDVVFLYVAEADGFSAINRKELDFPIYETYQEAEKTFLEKRITYTNSPEGDLWIKAEFSSFLIHYKFEKCMIHRITIIARDHA